MEHLSKYHQILYILFLLGGCLASHGQQMDTRLSYRYSMERKVGKITIDGRTGAGEWDAYALIDTLYNHDPSDVGLATYRSEIKLTYDDENLYIYAKHYDDGERVVQSLQRDSDLSQWESDSFTVALDPINKKQSGIVIGVNAGGAEMDGSLLVEPARTTYTDSWDTSWISATNQYDDHWIVELAIPFNSLRYNEVNTEWGINFIRGHKAKNFYYTWTPFPINFNGIDVNYMGTLQWSEVPKVKGNIAFVKPYATGTSFTEYREGVAFNTSGLDAGVDAKIGITKSLNLDIAYNPDFSNADVDQEVTNITRFDISLPEQREFFLENADIFSNFGSYSIFPFFSRRIGLDVPILYGARVTGNIVDELRIGIMNVQTKREEDIDPQNTTLGAFNYNLWGRSQLRGIFVNRHQTGNRTNDYGRNYGAELTYISKKGNLNNSIKYHRSSTSADLNGSYFGMTGGYATKRFRAGWTLDVLDRDYQADLGFTPRLFNYDADADAVYRKGYIFLNPFVTYRFFAKEQDSKLIFQGFRFYHNIFLNPDGTLNERDNNLAYDRFFKNTSRFSITASQSEVNLGYATNFLGSAFDNLPIGNYGFNSVAVSYNSDVRRVLVHTTSLDYGGFYNGHRLSGSVSGTVRLGYWGNIGLAYNYNNIALPGNYGDLDLHLIRFRGAFSFTKKLFFNNVVQYNTQSTNFSIFSKLQWRYAPLSDVFLIYNQNNNTHGFDLVNRSIILKLTYRFAV